MKRILSIILFLSLYASSEAFHIVGGEITYEYQGNDTYEVTLIVYRDCFSAGAPFDNPAAIGVFDGNGLFVDVFSFIDPFITPVETTVDFACTNIDASACVEKGIYIQTITLPPNDSGYYIAYQRCCRNTTIQNLVSPDEYGATYAAFIPPVSIAEENSSPVFNDLPPVGLCQNIPFTFDHGAEDLDGDSLVYEFCTPYNGATQDNPQPATPDPPPWSFVVWEGGFDVDDQITADPIFTLDPNTGLMTGTPTQIGQYVMGVCVKEFRDGVLLSEVKRDFQFNVVPCPSAVLASFADLSVGVYCEGLEIQFQNLSANADNFLWQFGDGTISTDYEPVHTFEGIGEYTVMLISEPGEECADTSMAVYTIAPNPDPELLEPVLNCPDNTYDIEVGGDLTDVIAYQWNIDSPDGPEFFTGPLLTDIEFSEPGLTYIDVLVFNTPGCQEETTLPFTVPNPPIAAISPITDPCQGLSLEFESQSQFADQLTWDFGDPGNTTGASAANPTHLFSQSGVYTVTLIAGSSNSCPDETSIEVEVNPALEIDFIAPDPQCLEGNSFLFETSGTYSDNASFEWSFDDSGIPSSTLENPGIIQFPEEGTFQVIFTVTEGSCQAIEGEYVYIVGELDVDFVTQGSGCAPYDAFFFDQTTGGADNNYTWSFGDETGSDFPGSVVHFYPEPGIYDVTLTVESTFGCLDQETLTIEDAIIVSPSPTADFVMEPPFADINQPFVNITSTAIGADDCLYLIEGNPPVESCDFTQEFLTGGEYLITQVVTNEFGCEDRIEAPFRVNGHSFYAPNAITLNQDGLNDFFVPIVSGEIEEYRMQIYDRWGNILFETDEVGVPWVPDYAHVGMHAFKVWVQDSYNTKELYEGTFLLLR
ncbi:MAG: PKD domain-containing protein [Flavobacteriales bacterium]|nr:PKD domain-containing protein [Flavobacteriales bacterium]